MGITDKEKKMERKSFVNCDKPLVTAMIKRTGSPERCIDEINRSIEAGAEAFGFQCDNLPRKFHNESDLRRIFASMQDKPIYATNYKLNHNAEISYDELADELLMLCDYGATILDITGDMFCKSDDELTFDAEAMRKQSALIEQIHKKGCEVLMSSHVNKFTPAERVLEIALGHQRRGADVSKIVVHSNTMEEQMENMRIITLLKEKLDIKFLFLTGGKCCMMHRRLGILLGNCASLCMLEVPEGVTDAIQPLIKEQLMFRDQLNLI